MGGHPSRPAVAGGLERSTRRHRAGSPRTPAQDGGGPPSLLDLAPGGVYRAAPVTRCAGGLLHHRFTLTSRVSGEAPLAVCSLWHCPAGHPGSPLTTTLPCGARTFLGDGVSPADATARPTRPSCRSVYGPTDGPGRGPRHRGHAAPGKDTPCMTRQLAKRDRFGLSQADNTPTVSASGRSSPPHPGKPRRTPPSRDPRRGREPGTHRTTGVSPASEPARRG